MPCRWIGLERFWEVEWDVLGGRIVDGIVLFGGRRCHDGVCVVVDTPFASSIFLVVTWVRSLVSMK